MKKAEIDKSKTYLVRVCGELVEVRIIGEHADFRSGRTKYEVARVDTGKVLPKHRSPAALRSAR